MSNLPPGVTGNEYQIAGPDSERDEERTCGAEGVDVITLSTYGLQLVKNAVDALGAGSTSPEERLRLLPQHVFNLRMTLTEVETETLVRCPFEGFVTVVGFQGVLTWECPVCRTQYDEEVDRDGYDG